MALPWLIGAAVVAGVGYLASDDDEPEECIYCSRIVYRDDMCKRHYREEQEEEREAERERVQRRTEQEAKRRIESEIASFQETSRRQISNKYGVEISFNNVKVNIVSSLDSKITYYQNYITMLDNKNRDIENLIADLQRAKNEI